MYIIFFWANERGIDWEHTYRSRRHAAAVHPTICHCIFLLYYPNRDLWFLCRDLMQLKYLLRKSAKWIFGWMNIITIMRCVIDYYFFVLLHRFYLCCISSLNCLKMWLRSGTSVHLKCKEIVMSCESCENRT